MPSTSTRELSKRDVGYSAPSRASVYALAEPDPDPLPETTRTLVVWEGPYWTEIDLETANEEGLT